EALNGMAGTRVECSGSPRFVTPAVQSPNLRAYDGSTGTMLADVVLAGGALFDSRDSAAKAGARTGWLRNASSVASLGNQGPAVIIGSTDGYLYIVEACSMSLKWAVWLGAPVGEPTVGDVDGDGYDEIMVAAADGYVYGLDHPGIFAPANLLLN